MCSTLRFVIAVRFFLFIIFWWWPGILVWPPSSSYTSSCLWCCICAAYFSTSVRYYCCLCLICSFALSLLDSHPQTASYLSLLASLSSSHCSFPHYKDVFLVNTYYLAWSSSLFLPLFPSATLFLLTRCLRGFACVLLHYVVESSFSCQNHLILLPLLKTVVTRDPV